MNPVFNQDFFAGKQLLVFGAGYVGAAVAESFLDAGGGVTALTRNVVKAARLRSRGISTIEADISVCDWHDQVVIRPDFVLNCVSSGGGGLRGYQQSYLEGSKSIVAWALRTGQTGHLIYTGSTSVYAHGQGAVVDESMPADASDERALILLETERTLSRWPGPWTLLRLAGIYGPDRHHLLDGLRTGGPTVPGIGETLLNLVHRDDIVSAILGAFSRTADSTGKIFNVTDDGCSTKAEVVDWLARRLGRSVPEFTGQSATGRRAFMPSRRISNRRISVELGWRPLYPTFREGYADILGA